MYVHIYNLFLSLNDHNSFKCIITYYLHITCYIHISPLPLNISRQAALLIVEFYFSMTSKCKNFKHV